jgi:hypothetical protein
MNHNEWVCDSSKHINFLLKDKGKYREDATERLMAMKVSEMLRTAPCL